MRITFAEAADDYIKRGWAVFPMSPEKKPLCKHGYKDATVNRRVIDEWSRRLGDEANIAIATGRPSGLSVLDVDGAEGEEALAALSEMGVIFPDAPAVTTGRGRHIYMRHDRHMKSSASKLGPGLDIRADGGSITAPPSIHRTGVEYTWLVHPGTVPPQQFPMAAMLTLYRPRVRIEAPQPLNIDLGELTGRIATALPGTRNSALNASAYLAGRMVREGRVAPSEAELALVQAGMAAGLDRRECEQTVSSGMRAGMEP